MLKKHVVIVGGGWAGVRLVRKLKKLSNHEIRITLVSNEPNFRYSSALYRVATGHNEKEAIIPIHELINDIEKVNFIKGTIETIKPKERIIKLANDTELHYDYAVMCIGAVTTYFGIPGIKENSFSIKTRSELKKFRKHLHNDLIEYNRPDKNYIIIGAGPTGVELSAAMASYMRTVVKRHGLKRKRVSIHLIEAAPRVLPNSDVNASRLAHKQLKKLGIKIHVNNKVEQGTDESLSVNGRIIQSRTVIWTAGVANNPFYSKHKSVFHLNNRGKVIVDDHLRVDKHLYVIGDNAVTPFSGLGYTAVHNANYVADEIIAKIKGHKKTKGYKPSTPPTVVPVGKNFGVFQYRKIVIGGLVGGILRSLADLTAYNDIAGLKKAVYLWLHTNDPEESCHVCKSKLSSTI